LECNLAASLNDMHLIEHPVARTKPLCKEGLTLVAVWWMTPAAYPPYKTPKF